MERLRAVMTKAPATQEKCEKLRKIGVLDGSDEIGIDTETGNGGYYLL
jgi:hypothetical protein